MSIIDDQFANWLRPADLGMDGETTANRLRVVKALAQQLTETQLTDLVRHVFGSPMEAEQTLTSFTQAFKKEDPNFLIGENAAEVLALAGTTVASAMNFPPVDRAGKLATVVLVASAAKTRSPSVQFDLLGLADEALLRTSTQLRKRPQLDESASMGLEEAESEAASEAEEKAAPALADVAIDVERLNEICAQLVNRNAVITKSLKLQDEELEIVWWLVTGWSNICGKPFDQIPAEARPVVFALELATKCKQPLEMPSLRTILSRAGVEHPVSLTIPTAINACGERPIATAKTPKHLCKLLTPIGFAIARAQETGGGSAWVENWSAATKVKKDAEIDSLDIGVQLYREQILFG